MRTLINQTKPVDAYLIFKQFYENEKYVKKLDEAMIFYISFCSSTKTFSAKAVAEMINENPTENYIEILTIVHFIRHDYLIDELLQRENKRLYIIQNQTKKAIQQNYAMRLLEDETLKEALTKAEFEWRNKEQNCLNTIATLRALKDLITKFQR